MSRMIRVAILTVLPVLLLGQAAPAQQKPEVQTKESQDAMTPAEAIERLREGNGRFVANAAKRRDWSAKVVATASGQFPFAAVLGCMDSRAPLEIVFDQGLGDMFGVRVAGNVVNDDELGSLEYAVKGAIDGVQLGNLTGLLAKIQPAVVAAGCRDAKDEGCVTRVAEANVRLALGQIRDKSPYLRSQIDAGTVGLVGALYDVSTGEVRFLER